MSVSFPLLATPGTFVVPALVLGGIYGARYLLFAGLAFAGWYGGRVRAGKLQPGAPTRVQILREIRCSAVAVAIFGAINGLLAWSGALSHARLYLDVAAYGWAWFWLSIPVLMLAHDTYFYWSHRLLHHPALFRRVHRVHHLSTNPTPWTAYAFHPSESVVQAMGIVLILFVIPVHPVALLAFQTISTAINVYGHSGYELYPPTVRSHPVGRWLNTSMAHNTHHALGRHNYGLYFLIWDRLTGTLDPRYERRRD